MIIWFGFKFWKVFFSILDRDVCRKCFKFVVGSHNCKVNSLVCDKCNRSFDRVSQMLDHPCQKLVCQLCKRHFKTYSKMLMHKCTCKNCHKMFSSSWGTLNPCWCIFKHKVQEKVIFYYMGGALQKQGCSPSNGIALIIIIINIINPKI